MAEVRLDHAGIAELLTSPQVRELLTTTAQAVAQTARAQGRLLASGKPVPVTVAAESDTDRARVSVGIPHPAGIGMQARHGLLSRSAEENGLTALGLDGDGPE
ncbi:MULTISPECIES: hypothetical protein [unclassified Crossiella]|uniref:hypothetical protein n=1 Tax=unclassified Crossiella TaxID=2620835 RepID=UPI001FFFECC6|nr:MULTISPECIES: hypothetical protein [unclassified Crossiella]MCK2239397.1 hypothetical protein [Crossiella sp. S99.2]MCK2252092.1 hypothetical protein [Crossiella sp. S99.1]